MTKHEITEFNRVLEEVAKVYQVSTNAVLGMRKMRPLPEARQMICLLLAGKVHPAQLGQMIKRERSTIIHSRTKMKDRIFIYPDTRKLYEKLLQRLGYDDQTK